MKSAKSVEKLKLLEALFVLWIIKNHWLYFVCLFVCSISLAQAIVMRIFGFCLKTILISCITENVCICFLNGKIFFVWATKFYVYFLRCMLKIVLSTVFVRLFDLCWTTIFFFLSSFYWNFGRLRHWKYRQKPFSPYTHWLFPVCCHNEYGRIQ